MIHMSDFINEFITKCQRDNDDERLHLWKQVFGTSVCHLMLTFLPTTPPSSLLMHFIKEKDEKRLINFNYLCIMFQCNIFLLTCHPFSGFAIFVTSQSTKLLVCAALLLFPYQHMCVCIKPWICLERKRRKKLY